MAKSTKILVADGFLSFLIGIKLGDMFTAYLAKIEIGVAMNADQIGAILVNYNALNKILMILFGIVFCTFGLSVGLLVDRIKGIKGTN